ncbi:MAG: HAMP domain-containing protein, partial [Magnetospirillum sp.]|nr:HAMP domain-containing protein [Magnetospirillum sp.]
MRPRGLSSKIYLAFLITSVIPTSIAGLVGIFYSLDVLKGEMLLHLRQEAEIRADAQTNFFRQLSSELLYLASSSSLSELAGTIGSYGEATPRAMRLRIKRDFSAFAQAYPHIYQLRFLDGRGREVVRVDRRDGRIYDVPESELQDKADRYYVQEVLALRAGEIYISPLDLNVEGGQVEHPLKPVIRLGTPIVDDSGAIRGLLVVNLHAEVILGHIQDMADSRGGNAYLFDRSGFYLARSPNAPTDGEFRMSSLEELSGVFPRPLLASILEGQRGTEVLSDWIVAYAPIVVHSSATAGQARPLEWAIVLAYPREKLFAAVFSLYFLYGVLAIALVVTATGGFLLSRNLLKPLMSLAEETEEIAHGNFTSRVDVRGGDEIAELGRRFNAMAERLEQYYASLEDQKQHLEREVRARTAALDRERQNLATVIQNTADGILSLSQDGVVELANAAAVATLSADGTPIVGEGIDRYWSGWSDYLVLSEEAPPVPRLLTTKVGERTLALSIAPVSGEAIHQGYILVVRDVSEERRLQDERRELDRQIFQMEKMTTMGELAMGLAHEIGNPLAGMKTVVQALRSEDLDAATTGRYLSRIEDEVNRLSSFLRTFHGFAAPQETFPRACTLDDVLEDVLLWTRKEALSRGIAIECRHCAKDIPKLWADPNQLKQVLLNLVINAIHATRDGGRITVGMCGSVRPEDRDRPVPRMRFCVDDTGEGIPPEVLPSIFDPFFTTRASGSGLG